MTVGDIEAPAAAGGQAHLPARTDAARPARAEGPPDRLLSAGALLVCAVATAMLYGPALRFAFTFDDPLDLPRAEGRSVWSLFSSSEGYAYYRPIPFVLWRGLRAIQGRYSEATLHGLTLICHALAAWLLYALLRRLLGSHWGIIPALLFIAYPFSYQAAFGAHTLFHPLMTAALLASLVLYHDARGAATTAGRAARLASSLLCAAIGLWTHESGVIILPLVVGLELLLATRAGDFALASAARRVLPHAVATGLFVLVWATVPKFARPDPWSPASLLPNARYFLQGAIWPVAAQLNALGARLGFDPVRALWPAIGLTLVALLALYAAARRPWWPIVALAATGVILIPAWLVLTWAYVEDAPRLLYPAAPAIAALWGLLPALRFRRPALTAAWRAIALAALLAVAVQSVRFIEVRRDMWAEGTRLIHAVADTGAARGDHPTLFLNVPAWFAPKRPEFPVGHVGLTALPGYVGLGRSVYIHRGVQPPIESRGYYPDLNGWKYDFNTHGGPAGLDDFATLLRRVDAVYLVEMLPDGARVREVGALTPGAADPAAPGPRFAGAVALAGAAVGREGDDLAADLTWAVAAPVPGDGRPVLRLRDANGGVAAEWRADPIAGIAPARLWRPGDRVTDRALHALPADLPPGTYTIWLSWEDRATAAPIAGVAADGTPLPTQGLALGEFTLP